METSADPAAAGPDESSTAAPGPAARLRYTVGLPLPHHLGWVRHDLTDAGWRWRVVGRILLQALPLAVVLGLLPGPIGLRLTLSIFLLAASGGTAYGLAFRFRDRRLRQHGFPVESDG